SQGNTMWANQYNLGYAGVGPSGAYSGLQTNDGGFIAVGNGITRNAADWDIIVLKTDSLGNKLWSKCYNHEGDNYVGYDIQKTNDNGFIIACNEDWYRIYLIRIDSIGKELWEDVYRDTYSDGETHSVRQTSDSGFILSGMYRIGLDSPTGFDIAIMKISKTGVLEYKYMFGWDSLDMGYSIQRINDSSFIIGGYTNSFGFDDYDMILAKIKFGGTTQSDEIINLTEGFILKQNFPNPFRGKTKITYRIPERANVNFAVYNIGGRIVKTFFNGARDKGEYSVFWDARLLNSGVYFLVFKANNYKCVKKAVLIY
ncbi:MAG: T9SS type A sorting domain-containing protein, partial [Elusimicrobiota bacterium]